MKCYILKNKTLYIIENSNFLIFTKSIALCKIKICKTPNNQSIEHVFADRKYFTY